jgi:hypothetical protein
VAFGASATLNVEIGGTVQGTGYDHINVTGDLTLDGALEVALINGFIPSAGQSFNILDWLGTRSGTFAALELPALSGSLAWNTSELYTVGILSVGLPGDFNNNGTVDAADYVIWRKTDGTQAGYNLWRSHFGQTAGSGTGTNATAAVPETKTLVLLLAAIAGAFVRQRP